MHKLGGSASVSEQEDAVASLLNLSARDVAQIHRGNRSALNYRLAWARNYLKRFGLLENSARGVWTLTPKGAGSKKVSIGQVKKYVKSLDKGAKSNNESDNQDELDFENEGWRDELIQILKNLPPDGFERLCQRLLRESGFIQVEVTGRSGDGGIDGQGVVRIGGLLSFHVLFQCKRYKGSVSPSIVRDFRGAMVGRADKGLLITTGTFTRDARREAQRDGATQIDLIDGEELVNKLKELSIGVETKKRVEEDVAVDKDFFDSI